MNRQKGLAPILIILLIAFSIGGYLVYSGKINLNNSESTISQTTHPSPIPSSSETANWKTYTNTKYQYSIKFPSYYNIVNYPDLKLLKVTSKEDSVYINKNSEEIANASKSDTEYDQKLYSDSLRINVSNKACATSANDLLEQSSSGGKKNITVGGMPATQFIGIPSAYDEVLTNISKDSHCFTFSFYRDPNNKSSSDKLLETILSTFKFTN